MLEEKDGNLQDPVANNELDPQNEIDASNAEDAEDQENESRHSIPEMDYDTMNLENLVGALQRLVKNEKIQAIKKHVDQIKSAPLEPLSFLARSKRQ